MPRDWPDPRWPDRRVRWYHLLLPAAVVIWSAVAFLAGIWPA